MLFARHESIIGSSAIFCCSKFNRNFSDFFYRLLILVIKVLYNKFVHNANDADICSANLLAELISVHDGLSNVSLFRR